jgi:hypothetical protein
MLDVRCCQRSLHLRVYLLSQRISTHVGLKEVPLPLLKRNPHVLYPFHTSFKALGQVSPRTSVLRIRGTFFLVLRDMPFLTIDQVSLFSTIDQVSWSLRTSNCQAPPPHSISTSLSPVPTWHNRHNLPKVTPQNHHLAPKQQIATIHNVMQCPIHSLKHMLVHPLCQGYRR